MSSRDGIKHLYYISEVFLSFRIRHLVRPHESLVRNTCNYFPFPHNQLLLAGSGFIMNGVLLG